MHPNGISTGGNRHVTGKDEPASGKVLAKTGTGGGDDLLGGGSLVIKDMAGYITTRSGRHLAFSLYIGPLIGPASEATGSVVNQIFAAMANAAYVSL